MSGNPGFRKALITNNRIQLVIILTAIVTPASDQAVSLEASAAPIGNTAIACQTITPKVSETPRKNTAEVSTTKPGGCPPAVPIECQVATLKPINSGTLEQSVDNSYLLIYADKDQFTEIINAIPSEAKKAQLLQVATKHLDVLAQQSPERVNGFLAQTVEVVRTFKQPESKATIFVDIAKQLVQLKQSEEAAEILPLAFQAVQGLTNQKQKEVLLVELVSLYAAVGDFTVANQITLNLPSVEAREEAKGKLAEGYAEAGQLKEALEALSRIKEPSYKVYALERIAAHYTNKNQKAEATKILLRAFEVAKAVDDDQSRASVLTDLAVEFAKAKLDRQAFQVIQTIDSDRRASQSYDLAHYYLENAQYDKEQQVIEVMRQMGDREWVNFTLSDLAQKYIEQKRYDEALKIANSLDVENQKMGASFSTGSESRSGKLGVLTYLASAYAKNGEQKKSNELFNVVFKLAQTADPSQMAEVAITYYETTGDQQGATKLVDQALQKLNQKKSAPSQEFDLTSFHLNSIATAYSIIGQYEKTIQIIARMQQLDKDDTAAFERFGISSPSSGDSILNAAAINLSYKGQLEEAIKFAGSIKNSREKDKAFNMMAQFLVATKQYEQAFQLTNKISDVAERDRLIQLINCAKGKQ